MDYAAIVFKQLIYMTVYSAVGIVSVKTGVMNKERLGALSGLVTKIIMPILLFTNVTTSVTMSDLLESSVMLLLTAIMYGCIIAMSFLLAAVFHVDKENVRVYRAASIFGNSGFLGIPLMLALFPEKGMLFVSVYSLIELPLVWTYGVSLLSPAGSGKAGLKETIRKIINPCIIAIIAAILSVVIGFRLPSVIETPFATLGSTMTPLAMLYVGGILCYVDIRKCIRKVELYGTVIIKMTIFPVILFCLLGLIPGLNADIRMAMTVFAALPTFTACPLIADSTGLDSRYATEAVFITTASSLLTLPLVCIFISFIMR